MTFAVYAALGGVFLFLVLALQVVAGFSPLQAGAALLPVTLMLLLLSSRMGALATRIGPRLPDDRRAADRRGRGRCCSSRVDAGTTYVVDVLPGGAALRPRAWRSPSRR